MGRAVGRVVGIIILRIEVYRETINIMIYALDDAICEGGGRKMQDLYEDLYVRGAK